MWQPAHPLAAGKFFGHAAPLLLKGLGFEAWFQRIEIQRKSVKLLIAVALLFNVIRL